jgi:hypothetical protein
MKYRINWTLSLEISNSDKDKSTMEAFSKDDKFIEQGYL